VLNITSYHTKTAFLLILTSVLSCSNYVGKINSELLYFGKNEIEYDSIYKIPYSENKFPLLIQTRYAEGTCFYRSPKPLDDTFFVEMRQRKDKEYDDYLKKHQVKFHRSSNACGYMLLSKMNLSFVDTFVAVIDSISINKNDIEGKLFLRIKNIGQTDLKTITPDTTFYVHFAVDDTQITITNTGYSKRWNRHAFLFFSWPIQEK
jgi:hypothetical protein